MSLLKIVEWTDNTSDTIVHKVDMRDNVINRGSKLIVRESQVAIFCDKGRMADVFLPGTYKLNTDSLPIITRMLSWAYGFETPYKSDVYFVNTKQFVNCKWGTATPFIIRDAEYGAVRVRGYGTYSFRVKDAFLFMQQLAGTNSTYQTSDITDYIRSILVMGISEAVCGSGISVIDMAANLSELGEGVRKSLSSRFQELGLELCMLNFENFSLPDEIEKALDENMRLGILRRNVDVYTRIAQSDALKEAAKNNGEAGGMVGAGVGMGLGIRMSRELASASATQGGNHCAKCGAVLSPNAKFCEECGTAVVSNCPECGAVLSAGAKYCPKCGKKVR